MAGAYRPPNMTAQLASPRRNPKLCLLIPRMGGSHAIDLSVSFRIIPLTTWSQTMPSSREGSSIPNTNFKVLRDGKVQDVSSAELFKGRRVILFALPGAYTPTCSTGHVPRFVELAPELRKHGIDDVICLSVNDPFVMAAWQRDQNAESITFLPDGDGTFTNAMGMLVDKSAAGLGKRSWRYSMVVNDGHIEKMFVEPDEPGDP